MFTFVFTCFGFHHFVSLIRSFGFQYFSNQTFTAILPAIHSHCPIFILCTVGWAFRRLFFTFSRFARLFFEYFPLTHQFFAGLLTFLFPGASLSVRKFLLPFHQLFGILIFLCCSCAALLGISEYAAWHHRWSKNTYLSFRGLADTWTRHWRTVE